MTIRSVLLSALCVASMTSTAAQIDLTAPVGSGRFGEQVRALANGNFVVSDPSFDSATETDVGAVHLYNPAGVLISTLTGSSFEDNVGSGGIIMLANGHYVVVSPRWDDVAGNMSDVGAVTWVDGATGLNGTVTPANSLIGARAGDSIGRGGVQALANGHYLVRSQEWDNGVIADAGAVTWRNGSGAFAAIVSTANSLVGSAPGDRVGDEEPLILGNGHLVLRCISCDIDGRADAGAVTWMNATTGRVGAISASNSLVGASIEDYVGSDQRGVGVYALSNGHYVVVSSAWDNAAVADVGAVTWGDGNTGTAGLVGISNSVVGTRSGDQVGNSGVTVLGNGHYVINSDQWLLADAMPVGAVTWVNGGGPGTAAVSAGNSLIGTGTGSRVGSAVALSNGHYVVASPGWDNGATPNVGAVTWADGNTGLVGVVASSNSLIGSLANDAVGQVTALSNGHYVVVSTGFNNGAAIDAGAVTFVLGNAPHVDTVSAANSLIGSRTNDRVGSGGVMALSDGNYVVSSFEWDNGTLIDVGATTFASGSSGLVGVVAPANSLIGASAGDRVGFGGVTAISNGGYHVSSLEFDQAGTPNVGASTWVLRPDQRVGVVSAQNALIGLSASDQIGNFGMSELATGDFVVVSADFRNGVANAAGAITWLRRDGALRGTIDLNNSVLGANENGGSTLNFSHRASTDRTIVGLPQDNRATLFTIPPEAVFGNGFE